MTSAEVTTFKGVKDLNIYLADRSYIEGYQPTQADVAILETFGDAPNASCPHVLRWYNHIKSHDLKKLPEKKKNYILESETAAGKAAPAAGKPAPATGKAAPAKAAEEDDDVDLFGSDEEEDAEAARIREERLKAYAEKKSKKPVLIAKSSIVIDVKPWGDETNMEEMEKAVRSIQMDGLVWGASKFVPVGYGIRKLQIMCVVEDEKVSVDLLVEQIQEFEDFVQSVDIAAFNKI